MKYGTGLQEMYDKMQGIRYDLYEGDISRKEAISQMEKLRRRILVLIRQYDEKNIRLSLKYQQLDISVELYIEMLKQKNNLVTP